MCFFIVSSILLGYFIFEYGLHDCFYILPLIIPEHKMIMDPSLLTVALSIPCSWCLVFLCAFMFNNMVNIIFGNYYRIMLKSSIVPHRVFIYFCHLPQDTASLEHLSPGSRFAFLWPIQMTQSQIVRAVSWEGYEEVCILLVSPFTLWISFNFLSPRPLNVWLSFITISSNRMYLQGRNKKFHYWVILLTFLSSLRVWLGNSLFSQHFSNVLYDFFFLLNFLSWPQW